ncbi:MAG: hypothetical protein U0984_11505 [Prosthecobacter sp.]|nr:hypothetical protein [Prosthecobacter sp.]
MKWALPFLILAAILLSSCKTTTEFTITSRSGPIAKFTSTYKRVNMHGGSTVLVFARDAKNFTVRSAKAAAAKEHAGLQRLAITEATVDHSLSGYYTFTLTGRMEFGKEPFEGPLIIDNANFIPEAQERAAANEHALNRVSVSMRASANSNEMRQLNQNLQNQNRSLDSIDHTLRNSPALR